MRFNDYVNICVTEENAKKYAYFYDFTDNSIFAVEHDKYLHSVIKQNSKTKRFTVGIVLVCIFAISTMFGGFFHDNISANPYILFFAYFCLTPALFCVICRMNADGHNRQMSEIKDGSKQLQLTSFQIFEMLKKGSDERKNARMCMFVLVAMVLIHAVIINNMRHSSHSNETWPIWAALCGLINISAEIMVSSYYDFLPSSYSRLDKILDKRIREGEMQNESLPLTDVLPPAEEDDSEVAIADIRNPDKEKEERKAETVPASKETSPVQVSSNETAREDVPFFRYDHLYLCDKEEDGKTFFYFYDLKNRVLYKTEERVLPYTHRNRRINQFFKKELVIFVLGLIPMTVFYLFFKNIVKDKTALLICGAVTSIVFGLFYYIHLCISRNRQMNEIRERSAVLESGPYDIRELLCTPTTQRSYYKLILCVYPVMFILWILTNDAQGGYGPLWFYELYLGTFLVLLICLDYLPFSLIRLSRILKEQEGLVNRANNT